MCLERTDIKQEKLYILMTLGNNKERKAIYDMLALIRSATAVKFILFPQQKSKANLVDIFKGQCKRHLLNFLFSKEAGDFFHSSFKVHVISVSTVLL